MPRNRPDYLFYDRNNSPRGLLEAKRINLKQGFVQACIQLLCLQAVVTSRQDQKSAAHRLFAIVSDGYRYLFIVLTGRQLLVEGPTVYRAQTWDALWFICGKAKAVMLQHPPSKLSASRSVQQAPNANSSSNSSSSSSDGPSSPRPNASSAPQQPPISPKFCFQLFKRNLSPCKVCCSCQISTRTHTDEHTHTHTHTHTSTHRHTDTHRHTLRFSHASYCSCHTLV